MPDTSNNKSWFVPIAVAIIGAVSTIAVAVINKPPANEITRETIDKPLTDNVKPDSVKNDNYPTTSCSNPNINLQNINEATLISSQTKFNYIDLRNLLANCEWKKADHETLTNMLEVLNRQNGQLLSIESIANFPCEDLKIIDQLWQKSSQKRFGFSVQKKIWQEKGGEMTDYDTEKKLGELFGWREKGKWKSLDKLTFSLNDSTPSGHLPAKWRWSNNDIPSWNSSKDLANGIRSIVLRAKTCNL